MRRIFLIPFFLFFCFTAFAQLNRIGISTEYNFPLGNLAWTYKPAPGIQVSYGRSDRHYEKGISIAIGYTVFQPLEDTLYYIVDRGGTDGVGLGKAVYSPYKILQLGFYAEREITLSKKVFLNLVLGAAYYYGKRDISFTDEFGGEDGISELASRAALIPKACIGYRFSDTISINPYFAYNFLIEVGSTNPNAINYNENTGKISHFYTPGLALNFHF